MKIINGKETLRAGEIAKLAGVPESTIKFYSFQGLLPFYQEGKKNKRYIKDETLRRLDIIQKYKKKRYTLPEILEKLEALNG